jgi:DNA polymerase-3 subunit delta
MDALAFLERAKSPIAPLYVLHGDEAFLKRQAILALRKRALGDDADESAVSTFPGDRVQFASVWDELESLPFFSPKRVVLVENADPFVTKFRALLEKKIEANQLPASGVLILDVKTWASNTRLARMVDNAVTIVCKAPQAYRLPQWACEWTEQQHKKQMPLQAGQLLVEYVGGEMGLLEQEILKLVIYVGDRARITEEDVDRLVGNNRLEAVWKILELLGQGDRSGSLRLLQRSLEQGEEPMKLVGAIAGQLRKLALAARLNMAHKVPLASALTQAGIAPFAVKTAEQQCKSLGQRRLRRLYDSLLELQLDLRGNCPLPTAMILERFLVRLGNKQVA